MALSNSTMDVNTLCGLWMGGVVTDVATADFTDTATKKVRQYMKATLHVTGEEAAYVTIGMAPGTVFDPPKGQSLLVNVRAYTSKGKVRFQLAQDYPGLDWLPAPEATTEFGELANMVGLFAVGDYEKLVKRQWRDKLTNTLSESRFIKMHMPRPKFPEYLMLSLNDGVSVRDYEGGQRLTVPVSVGLGAHGLRYSLSKEFHIADAIGKHKS